MNKFTINGIQIKNPTSFKVERYNITNLQRLASAYMTGDLIAKKKKYYFTYDSISTAEFDTILSAIFTNTLFFTLSYTYEGKTDNPTVYVGNIPAELANGASKTWNWQNLTFDLIER